MDEIKAIKSESSTLSPPFNNQLIALELVEVEASPPFEETLPDRDRRGLQEIRALTALSQNCQLAISMGRSLENKLTTKTRVFTKFFQ